MLQYSTRPPATELNLPRNPCNSSGFKNSLVTLRQTNIAMENAPFVDVFPIGKGGFPIGMLAYRSDKFF